MKIVIRYVLVVLVALIVSVFWGQKVLYSPPPTPAQRTALTNDWVKGLNEVYFRTNNKEVYDQLIFLKDHGVPAIPKEGSMDLYRVMGADDIALVPLVKADRQLSPWRKWFDSPNTASYSGLDKNLILKSEETITPIFKGVIFAHELKHHSVDPSGNVLHESAMSYCREEVTVHEFSNQLIFDIGGQAYQKVLDERTAEMYKYFTDTHAKIPLVAAHLDELDKIFGSSLSQKEREIRGTNLEVGAMFLMVDRYYIAGDKEEQKALLIYQMYKANGNQLPQEKS